MHHRSPIRQGAIPTVEPELVLSQFVRENSRRHFEAYYAAMNYGTNFMFGNLQQVVANEVDSTVRDLEGNLLGGRLAVSQPPQTGKSSLITKEYLSFLLGAVPGIQIAVTGHSANLLYRFSNWIRDRVERHPLYSQVFPEARVKDGEDRVTEWALTNESRIMFRTVGQPLTGSHVDLLIIDDVYSGRAQAESPMKRQSVKEWYMANCLTRISPNGSIICVNTRWHKEDLIGYLTSDEYIGQVMSSETDDSGSMERDLFRVVNLPALCTDPESDLLGRKEGESIFPEYKSREWFLRVRAQTDSYEWESQYQGNPQTRAQSDLDLSRIRYITMEEVPEHLEVVRSWDLALSEKQLADFSAGAACAFDPENNRFYIIDVRRNKLTWVKNRKVILDHAQRDVNGLKENGACPVNRMGIEAVAGFGATFSDIHNALLGEVRVEPRFPPKGGKLLRAQPWLNRVESYGLYLVRAPWNKDFLAELESFPVGEHDDQIDSVSGAWEMLTGRNRNGVPGPPKPEGDKKAAKAATPKEQGKSFIQKMIEAQKEAEAQGIGALPTPVTKKAVVVKAGEPSRPSSPSRPQTSPRQQATVRQTAVVRPQAPARVSAVKRATVVRRS